MRPLLILLIESFNTLVFSAAIFSNRKVLAQNSSDDQCFNCNLPTFNCTNNGKCNRLTGICDCGNGFGGKNCLNPLCGGLTVKERSFRKNKDDKCCVPGFTGQVCNVCTSDAVCSELLDPDNEGLNATCYKGGSLVNQVHFSCEIKNEDLLELLHDPEITLECDHKTKECFYAFWFENEELFHCEFQDCEHSRFTDSSDGKTVNHVMCDKAQCSCVRGKYLCDGKSIIDLDKFFVAVSGPATFDCKIPDGYENEKFNCMFKEKEFVEQLGAFLGDNQAVELKCLVGECLYPHQIPDRPPDDRSSIMFLVTLVGSLVVVILCIGLAAYAFIQAFKKQQMYREVGLRDETDEDVDRLMDGIHHVPATLTFSNITYEIVKHGQRKKVLKGVHGQVKPGEVMAILGTSGAGKTTCLDILAGKNKHGIVNGKLLINGKVPTREQFKRISGYVDQEDTLMETLTVYETLMFSADLRLPKIMTKQQKQQRVRDTMIELGIEHIANSRIGSPGKRGISGGEKRRVSIAVELVTSPSVLYLDEPTSGLDAFNAYSVVHCLCQLAKKYNRTIILSIHQPRSNIFVLFDKLLLLAEGGYMVYSGRIFSKHSNDKSCLENWLGDLGASCPLGYNLADYLIDLTKTGLPSVDISTSTASNRTVSTDSEHNIKNQKDKESAHYRMTRISTTPHSSNHGENTITMDISDLTELQVKNPKVFPLVMGFLYSKSCAEMNEEIVKELLRYAASVTNSANPSRFENRIISVEDLAGKKPVTPASPELQNIITASSANLDVFSEQSPLIEREGSSKSSLAIPESPRYRFMFQNLFQVSVPNQQNRPNSWDQFIILSKRTFTNFYRNPLLMYAHYGIAFFLAFALGGIYFKVSYDLAGFQNRMGFFFISFVSFALMSLSSLELFATERLLFMRERSNGYYNAFVYYLSKILFDMIPLRVGPALVLGCISYYMVGLKDGVEFPKFLLVLVLFNMTSAAVCFVIAALCGRQMGLAMLFGVLMILFSILFSGFLLNKTAIPMFASFLQYLSFFNYAFEAVIVNEIVSLTLRGDAEINIPIPGRLILKKFGFIAGNYWIDTLSLFIYCLGMLVFGFIVLQFFVKEKR